MMQNLLFIAFKFPLSYRLLAVAYGRGSYDSATYGGSLTSGATAQAGQSSHWWIWLIIFGTMLIATGLIIWAHCRKNKIYTPPHTNITPQSPQNPQAPQSPTVQ